MHIDHLAPLPVPRINEQDYIKYLDTTIAVAAFLRSRQSKGLSDRTIRWYRGILNRFASLYPILPQSPEECEDFLLSCPGGDEWRHGYYRTIRTLYRFLAKRTNGRLANPVEIIDAPRRQKKLPKFLTLDQLGQLIDREHTPQIRELIITLADTGMRLDEAVHLRPEDLHQTKEGCWAMITGKTGARAAPMSESTYQMLLTTLPFKYHRDTYCHRISQAMKDAGIKGSAHTLRHTFATQWDGSDHDLQAILGHADPSTVQIYRHLRMSNLLRQHQKFSPLRPHPQPLNQ